MPNMPTLITSRDEAQVNIASFAATLEVALTKPTPKHHQIADQLSGFRAWYGYRDPVSENWLFGPSKWIGYAKIDLETYLRFSGSGGDLNGRVTEAVLRKLFGPADEAHPLHTEASQALAKFLARFGKKPSQLHRITVIPGMGESLSPPTNRDDDLAELIIRVGKGLPSIVRHRVAAALSAR